MAIKELPIPEFFNPDNARKSGYRADIARLRHLAQSMQASGDVSAAQADTLRILHLIIDAQDSFVNQRHGSLFVGGPTGDGAVQNCILDSKFIYRYAGVISRIMLTLDTHHPYQIFYPEYWLLLNGDMPNPGTLVLMLDGELCNVNMDGSVVGRVQPNPAITQLVGAPSHDWLVQYTKHYVTSLEQGGKYSLVLWPHHAMQGTDGHKLSGLINEAVQFHSLLRSTSPRMVTKGDHPLTECYSVFKAEVTRTHENVSLGLPDAWQLLAEVCSYDVVIISGQASSHCVASSVQDIVDYCQACPSARDTDLSKFYLLIDCMSPVVIPDVIDFSADADAKLKSFAAAGMHLVESTTPMDEWPDFPLTA